VSAVAAGPRAAGLREQVEQELGRPGSEAARALSDAIRERVGGVAAVVFYGSCLRRASDEGVHDFYVLVDGYRAAFGLSWLAAAGVLLPPNVFYLETTAPAGPDRSPRTLRCKYAVLSTRRFRRLVSPGALHPYVWARFAQPAAIVWARDDEARAAVAECAAQSVVTLVQRLVPFMPVRGGVQRFRLASLWQEAFRRTYRTELRSEAPGSIRALYRADPERYDACAARALEALDASGWIDHFSAYAGAAEVVQRPHRRWLARLRWQLCWPLAKTLALLRLVKTAFTFGDWLPYALWKLERHSGRRFPLSDRQRRHPFLFGVPVLLKALAQRTLR